MKLFVTIRNFLVLFFFDRQIMPVISQADYITGNNRIAFENKRKEAAGLHTVTPGQGVRADYITENDRITLENKRKEAAGLHVVTPGQEVRIKAFEGKVMISNFNTSRKNKSRSVFINLNYQFCDFEGNRYLTGHDEVDEQSVGTTNEKSPMFWRKCPSVPNTEAFIKMLSDCHENYLKVLRLQVYADQLNLVPETV